MTESNRSAVLFFGAAMTFVVTMMGTTLPTPLYPIYQAELGFSQLIITVIFAAYAVGVISALIVTGSWSDQLGRRPMLALGLIFSAASACAFLWGGGLAPLLLGRVLSGISAGIFTGTATVAVVELAPAAWAGSATLIATAANMGGLGLGPLFAGVLSQYLPAPLTLCFVADLVLIAIAGMAIALVPETAERPARPRLRIQSLQVPPEVRGVFIPAAIAGFAGFSVLGLFTAIAPAFMGKILNYDNHALTGAVVFLLFVASTVGQIGQARLPQKWRLPLGCIGLIIGIALVAMAIVMSSLMVLVTGAIVAGIGQGVAFRAGMGAVTAASPPARRGEVASTFFVVLYIAISIPVVGIGLAAQMLGLRAAGIGFSIAVAVLAAAALAGLIIRRRASD
ncbi:Major facilitator superfamily protein MFS 1 [Salinisphaera shabanensis E1L3A]|uniref:Major facilitator superfamily protein MFS 1 n=1 Tax=Salinisphaera shabanensis E1L3A TaxID=1033802 RepID=U2EQ99_9GAMM|nr:MFS transporter [Salinisphaera shabanensis]ERJ20237.1 Major facilitator superfamily protein MFS 1 [Salinisphaera shabanensis E1L3A]